VAPLATLASESAHRYSPFLLVSIALTLTFGATLGMINLARLTTPYFGGVTPGSVSAHAIVQVFGFVGLFVMGVASHVLPRFAQRPLAMPSLVTPILGLQAGGVMTIVAAFMLQEREVVAWACAAGSLALVPTART
jgi:heme/copper-type cytochrome/quinol oxidase subunit 1